MAGLVADAMDARSHKAYKDATGTMIDASDVQPASAPASQQQSKSQTFARDPKLDSLADMLVKRGDFPNREAALKAIRERRQ